MGGGGLAHCSAVNLHLFIGVLLGMGGGGGVIYPLLLPDGTETNFKQVNNKNGT